MSRLLKEDDVLRLVRMLPTGDDTVKSMLEYDIRNLQSAQREHTFNPLVYDEEYCLLTVPVKASFVSCQNCIHADDSIEICKLRDCVHAIQPKERFVKRRTALEEGEQDAV